MSYLNLVFPYEEREEVIEKVVGMLVREGLTFANEGDAHPGTAETRYATLEIPLSGNSRFYLFMDTEESLGEVEGGPNTYHHITMAAVEPFLNQVGVANAN